MGWAAPRNIISPAPRNLFCSSGSDWDSDWFVRVPIIILTDLSDSIRISIDERLVGLAYGMDLGPPVNDTRRIKPKFEVETLIALAIGIGMCMPEATYVME